MNTFHGIPRPKLGRCYTMMGYLTRSFSPQHGAGDLGLSSLAALREEGYDPRNISTASTQNEQVVVIFSVITPLLVLMTNAVGHMNAKEFKAPMAGARLSLMELINDWYLAPSPEVEAKLISTLRAADGRVTKLRATLTTEPASEVLAVWDATMERFEVVELLREAAGF